MTTYLTSLLKSISFHIFFYLFTLFYAFILAEMFVKFKLQRYIDVETLGFIGVILSMALSVKTIVFIVNSFRELQEQD